MALIAWTEFLRSKLKFTNEELELYVAERNNSAAKLGLKNQLILNCRELPDDIIDYINEKFKKFHIALKIPNTVDLVKGIKQFRILYLCALILIASTFIMDIVLYKLSRKSIFIKNYSDFFKNLDAIHYIGGGYFTDRWNLVLLYEFFLVRIAKKINPDLKIIGTGLGLGPFKKMPNRIFFKYFAINFDYLFVRDNISLKKLIEDLKIDIHTVTLGDDTILLFPFTEEIKRKRGVFISDKIAFNLKDISDLDYSVIKKNIENYLRLMKLQGCEIEYFCFGKKPGPDDRKSIKILNTECVNNFIIHDPYEEGWINFVGNLARVKMGFGFAYHFSVFLTLLGVPVVSAYSGEYYMQKMEGSIRFLNEDSVVLSMKELASVNIFEVMNAAKGIKQERVGQRMELLYNNMVLKYTEIYKNILNKRA